MILDTPISNRSDQWLKEMAELETEDCDDPYPALLLAPSPPAPMALPPPLPHAPPAAPDHRAVLTAGSVADGEALGAMSWYARMALCASCE